jgi:hypothetical protein
VMLLITGFTVYSGAEYVWGMRGVLRARFRRVPLDVLRLAGICLAIPLCWLPLLDVPGSPAYLILWLLAAELAVGGLDNSLAQVRVGRGLGWDLARSAIQAGTGLYVLAGPSPPDPVWARVAAGGALAATAGDLLVRAIRHAQVFRVPSPPGPGSPSRQVGKAALP